MKVDTTGFDLRNMAINKSGELTVRDGLWRYGFVHPPKHNFADQDGFECLEAFTVKSQFVDEIFLYAIGRNHYDNDIYLQVLTENLRFGNRKQVLKLGKYRDIRAATHAVVNGQLIISGPDIPTLWGYTGSGITVARKQPSVNTSTETLDIPNGICVSWAGRCVIAKGEALFVSDPLAPRTYTAGGIVTLPGIVYGLHVGVAGDLIAVTANGVYSLSSQAAAQGQGVIGSVQKLSSYRASKYKSSCITPQGVYGLTQKGIARIDVDLAEDIELSDKTYVRALTQMIDFPDYRAGNIYQTQRGLCVTMGELDRDNDDDHQTGVLFFDMISGLKSWWTMKGMTRLVAPIVSREGDDFFVFEEYDAGSPSFTRTGVMAFNRIGRSHGEALSGREEPEGFVSGIVASDLETSPVVRYVYSSADNGGNTISCAVRGQKFRRNGTLQQSTTNANGVVVGVDSWQENSDAPPAGQGPFTSQTPRYKTCELKRVRFDFAKKTNDISIEVAVRGTGARVRILNMTVAGYGVNTA